MKFNEIKYNELKIEYQKYIKDFNTFLLNQKGSFLSNTEFDKFEEQTYQFFIYYFTTKLNSIIDDLKVLDSNLFFEKLKNEYKDVIDFVDSKKENEDENFIAFLMDIINETYEIVCDNFVEQFS